MILNSKLIKNRDICNVLAINVRPINDIGSGLIATETLIYLTNNGINKSFKNDFLRTKTTSNKYKIVYIK